MLDDAAEIHHRDAVADVLDHREIVRDEQVGELPLALQVLQQVDDLRLDRDVERRHRLVADDQLGPERQRAGDADALALAARELVRVVGHLRRPQADAREQRRDLLRALLARWRCRARSSGSPTISPAVMRGLSEENGSWKMICICRR